MKKIDLLKDIYNKKITSNEAYSLFERIIQSKDANKIKEILCFTDVEYTAFAGQGIPLDIIARWRYEGWPNICLNCKQKIDLENFGWWIKENSKDYCISHINCPK